jgi:hypothetical protein
LAPEVIRSIVRANYSVAAACYERCLALHRNLKGPSDRALRDCGVIRCIVLETAE